MQEDEERMEKNLDDHQCISCGKEKLLGSDFCQECEDNIAADVIGNSLW